jgi:uncharacterized protein (DUF2147 family)
MRLLACLILLASTTAIAAQPTGVLGDWKTPIDAIIRVEPCGPAVCLLIVKQSPTDTVTTDQKNPDASLRNRQICGLTIGTGFHPSDPNHLADGHIYDPKSGHTYKGTVIADGDTLLLHGYIGISIFGRSETWHRVPPITPCK